MILGRPWALALLLVPPILLWLRLRAARPRAAEASSLLVWSKVSPAETTPARPRPPLAAWLEAAGAAFLVMGLADPASYPAGGFATQVLLDTSASMNAKGPDGRTRTEAARAGIGHAVVLVEAPGGIERAVSGGGPAGRVLAVTDHRTGSLPDDPPWFQTVGVGARGFNAGITAASGVPLEGGRWRLFLTIEAFGAPGPVAGTLHLGEAKEPITLTPGTPLEIARETPVPVESVRIEFAGDALAADESVTFREVGTGGVEYHSGGECPPLDRALAASGAEPSKWKVFEESILKDAGNPDRFLVLHFPTDASGGPAVRGLEVTAAGHPLTRDVRIDPTVELGARGTLRHREGTVLFSDSKGPLAVLGPKGECICFAFLPGGTWTERDPSFVVFARNLVERVAGGPPEIRAEGVLDAEETRQAAEGESFGDLAAALKAAARPDPATRVSLAPVLLLAGAGLLAAAWFAGRG